MNEISNMTDIFKLNNKDNEILHLSLEYEIIEKIIQEVYL